MTADRPTTASRLRHLLAAASLALLPALLAAPPATASTEAACEPDDTTACVTVMVLTEDNDRVGDVAVTVTGADFSADLTTADEPVSVAVPDVGRYTVALDPATLPDDQPLPEGSPAEIEVTAQTGGNARAVFRVGAGAAVAESPTESATTGGGTSGDTGTEAGEQPADGEGVGAAPEGDASERTLSLAQVWQQIGSGLRFGLLLALASIGLNLIFGTTGLSNFAHGEQFALGAALGFITINQMGMPIWLGAIVTLVACSLTGLAQDAGIWRPLRRRNVPVMQLMIVSIGLSITLQYVIQLLIGGGSERILSSNPRPLTLAGITLSTVSWISMVVALVCIIGIAWFLTRTRIGRATRAVSDNPALASATGIDPDKIVRIVWIMATGFAALAGLMWGISFGSFNWQLGVQLLLLMFAAVTLGGLGTAFGALVGSILIGLVVELSNLVIPSDLRYASALVILILVLLFRPQGILGRRERIG
ncbi:branched-chain amino acid ABC transporter permease [Isoptericola dokdonensis]|jgi:branched-chain amino acid transport system permease protein|uniref:High-affinity branched-chain amino acid transport system permease protein LivH n=1 Tax=Isoptericola dokdonensis DS-3 TaxID=1300344 RepID=A0A168FMF4_9MICO|nr:branched-chain amino acid ABC transporter permease [Isoptericola dokdonensis]ANC32130.1 High-affinity branched-chain amino acid transport system permease protein LivH [Isoptericola dokdonensis DS-3]